MGTRAQARMAQQPPPWRARPRARCVRDAGEDVQGHDRRDARLADGATAGDRDEPRRHHGARAAGARRGGRVRRPAVEHALPGRARVAIRAGEGVPARQDRRRGRLDRHRPSDPRAFGRLRRRRPGMPKLSAGLLVYRWVDGEPEVLLVHPGGPYWAKKDDGAWSLPKGEYEPVDDPRGVATREFREELGLDPPDPRSAVPLGELRQPSGKRVAAWALAGDLEVATVSSNVFTMEW